MMVEPAKMTLANPSAPRCDKSGRNSQVDDHERIHSFNDPAICPVVGQRRMDVEVFLIERNTTARPITVPDCS